ncbi:interleukin-17D [Menidia menidia]
MARWIRVPVRVLVLVLVPVLLHLVPVSPVVRKRASRTRACLDLPEEILEQMFGRLSVGVMSAFHHALQLEPQHELNLTCPTTAHAHTDGKGKARVPVNLLSVSPWAYRISYNPSRYPRRIPEAYCLCEGCLLGPSGAQSPRFQSQPVYAPAVVLRRTGACLGGRHAYAEVYVSVAVGCTCLPRPDHQNQNQQQPDRRRGNHTPDRRRMEPRTQQLEF